MLKLCLISFAVCQFLFAATEWTVNIHFDSSESEISPVFAGANINNAVTMLDKGSVFDDAVAGLGIKFFRFQGPLNPGPDEDGKWNYLNYTIWQAQDFQQLDIAVEKAYKDWRAEELMLCMHTLTLPLTEGGKLIIDDFDEYAEAVAVFVQRYATVGNTKIRYWEPFNELDHPLTLANLAANGQSFADVVNLFRIVAGKMKQINPDIIIGGPAMVSPSTTRTNMMLDNDGDRTGFISWHDYSSGSATTSDADILRTITHSNHFLQAANDIEDRIGYYTGIYQHPAVDMIISEYHLNYRAWSPLDVRTANQFGAVYAASVLSVMSETSVKSVMIHDVLSKHYGMVNYALEDTISKNLGQIQLPIEPDDIYVRPIGYVYKWFNELIGTNWVGVDLDVPSSDLDCSRGTLIDVAAWKGNGKYAAMIVNKDIVGHPTEINFMGLDSEISSKVLEIRTVIEADPQINYSALANGRYTCNMEPMSVNFLFVNQPLCDEVWQRGEGLIVDLNKDCYVDLEDLSLFIEFYLD